MKYPKSKSVPIQERISAFCVSQRGLGIKERNSGSFSPIDIDKAKEKALTALNRWEYLMWCQIERGEI